MSRAFFVLIWVLYWTLNFGQAFPTVEFESYAEGLTSPVDVVGSPFGSSDLYIVQRGTNNGIAQIRVVKTGTVLPEPFLTLTGISCCGERGLLSMAFHPKVADNGFFFVFYTAAQTGALTIARFKLKSINNFYEADPDSRLVVLSIPHSSFSNHNGGKLLFGPDGFLYFGTGDGGGRNDPLANGQNPQSLLGKVLRILPSVDENPTVPYTIPADNPYANPNDGVLDEIYSMGLRNPWRWSFDRSTGNAWIADVGQTDWEELNFASPTTFKGANFGWRCFEGNVQNNATGIQPCNLFGGQPHATPVYVYPHNTTTGGFSVTGGYVYRGAAYPALQGYYLMADYITPAIWLVKSDGTFQAQRQGTGVPPNISGFGETQDGEIWAISLLEGKVYSIKAEQVLSANHIFLKGSIQNNKHALSWTDYSSTGKEKYSVEVKDGNETTFRGIKTFSSLGTGPQQYQFAREIPHDIGQSYYRIKSEAPQNIIKYSQVIQLGKADPANHFELVRLQSGIAYFQLPDETKSIIVSDITGRMLQEIKVGTGTKFITVDTRAWQGRLLIFTVTDTKKRESLKIWNHR
jgi:glucose/arabinose dehydrogenase